VDRLEFAETNSDCVCEASWYTKGGFQRQRERIMVIAVESLLFLLGGVVLTVILMSLFGRQSSPSVPMVRLMRVVEYADGHEETRLVINDELIMSVSDDGLRQADYAAETERLEAAAMKIAAALSVNVSFSRVSARTEGSKSACAGDQAPSEQPEPKRSLASMRDRSSRS
jgi:hypothetical protein